jgi:hypothetical protein
VLCPRSRCGRVNLKVVRREIPVEDVLRADREGPPAVAEDPVTDVQVDRVGERCA